MLVAVKGNREETIREDDKQSFLDDGYRVLEVADGKVKDLTPKEIKGSKKDLESALEKVVELEAKNKELESESSDKDSKIDALEKEVEAAKAELDELKKEHQELLDKSKK